MKDEDISYKLQQGGRHVNLKEAPSKIEQANKPKAPIVRHHNIRAAMRELRKAFP